MPLVYGFLLGFALAIPPGGITVVGVHLTMTLGWQKALRYAAGTSLMDALFALAFLSAAESVSSGLDYTRQQWPWLVVGIQCLVMLILVIYGLLLIFKRTPLFTWHSLAEAPAEQRTGLFKHQGPFLFGLGLNFANLMSPTFLGALGLVVSQAHVLGLFGGGYFPLTTYAAGFGLGGFVYIGMIMYVATRFLGRLTDARLIIGQRIAAGLLIAIGIIIGLQAVGVKGFW